MSRSRFLFNSNRLDYIGKFIGVGGKIKTDFRLWRDVILGDRKALAKMVTYCKTDVLRLQQCFDRLAPYCAAQTHAGANDGKPRWTCDHCGSKKTIVNKHTVTAKGIKQVSMKCRDCGKYFTVSAKTAQEFQEAQ
jgi:hypothetical protein